MEYHGKLLLKHDRRKGKHGSGKILREEEQEAKTSFPLTPFCLLPPEQAALDRLELEGVPDRMTCDHDETFSFTYLNPLLVKSVFTLSWRSKLALTSNYLSMSLLEDRDITRPPIFPKH